MIRRTAVLLACAAALVAAGPNRPAVLFVSPPHAGALLYGPADMLCDLHKCRLFELPAALNLEANTIVEFGLPDLDGQGRIDLHRCFQICRASVLGYPSNRTSPPGHTNPTVFITPIELRLD